MSSEISQLLKKYIHNSTIIHNDRLQTINEANKVINEEYIHVENQLKSMKDESRVLNHEIDTLINSFNIVQGIQDTVLQTEMNIQLIFKAINRINKRLIDLRKNKHEKK